MKKAILLLGIFLSAVLAASPCPMQKKLVLPEKIYASAGIECNIYFRQIFMTVNPENYAFFVKCKKGRCEEKRWTYTPSKADSGSYDIDVEVHNDEGLVAKGKTQLIIVPADAGKGKSVSILIMGSSTIHMRHAIPRHLHALFKKPGNPRLAMIGENGPHWPDKTPGEIRHEGYGGWSYARFTTRGSSNSDRPAIEYKRRNPFWNPKTKSVDFKAYLEKNNQGKAPDYLLIALGGNDVFGCTDANIEERLKNIREQMLCLFAAIRKAAPETVIMLLQSDNTSSSQDAFGINYGAAYFRWQVKKNFAKFRELVNEVVRTSNDPNLVKVEATYAFDCENNVPVRKEGVNRYNRTPVYRQANALHPTDAGYNQLADVIYVWMKNHLNTRKK